MKKFTFFAALLVTLGSAFASKAQSLHMQLGDTIKKNVSGTGDVELKNLVINTTSANMRIEWTITGMHMDPKWHCTGFCDNLQCLGEADVYVGKVTMSAPFAPGPIEDYHVAFNADTAAVGSSAWISVNIVDVNSGDDTDATFIATKSATGITVVRADESAISVYPNPAMNYIDVRYPASADVRNIAIYNLIGKQVGNFRVSSNTSAHCEFNSDMPSGIYMVRITDSKGGVVSTRRFTKQ
jgi:hypothetical protein